jgi:hypothetical protein
MLEQTQMSRLLGLAALAFYLAAVAGSARAQAPEPGFRVQEPRVTGNVGGGGVATMNGGGDDMQVDYSTGGAGVSWGTLAQTPRLARMTGGTGDGPEVEYLDPLPSRLGREAWMVGGGDDARVVYASPYAAAMPSTRPRR